MEETSMERQPEMHRHTEEELPEVKIFDLLSSVGNGEHKALELIVMRPRVTYSVGALWRETINHQAKNRGWRMGRTLPFKHCKDSLSPIGLVAREALSPDDTAWGYEITEYGIRTGIPFAGVLLNWSNEHPTHSLYKMFASTVSTSVKDEQTLEKKRAPETRYKILWEIATNPNNRIRLTEIANGIDENISNISLHIEALSKSAIISYEATEAGRPYAFYRKKDIVPDQEPIQYKNRKTLSAEVYTLLTHEYLSLEEIVDLLIMKYPRYENLKRTAISATVSLISAEFLKQGYLERKKFSKDFRSQLTFSEGQREAIVSLVNAIDSFKNGDRQTIDKGRRFAQKVASDPTLFSELMLKAKEASPNANRTNRELMESYLISILHKYPKSTIRQIIQFLEQSYDKKLTDTTVRDILSRLGANNQITSEKTKGVNVYRVSDFDNQEIPGS